MRNNWKEATLREVGRVVMNSHDCITNQQINSLIVNDAEYDKYFVYYCLKNSYSLFRMHADGGSTMPFLNKSTFEGLTFSFLPLPGQKAIAAGIKEMIFVSYSEKDANSFGKTVNPMFNLSQIQTLSKLRDTLLPKLMKGEIRVRM
jgi:type I restriction enzyme S subunit